MSADFVVYNAQPGLMQPGTSSLTVYPNPFVALSVRALTEPVKLLLDEGQGTMRPASLETVTFGSQNLVKPNPASASFNAAAQDVW